jgi:hypothetical protein
MALPAAQRAAIVMLSCLNFMYGSWNSDIVPAASAPMGQVAQAASFTAQARCQSRCAILSAWERLLGDDL